MAPPEAVEPPLLFEESQSDRDAPSVDTRFGKGRGRLPKPQTLWLALPVSKKPFFCHHIIPISQIGNINQVLSCALRRSIPVSVILCLQTLQLILSYLLCIRFCSPRNDVYCLRRPREQLNHNCYELQDYMHRNVSLLGTTVTASKRTIIMEIGFHHMHKTVDTILQLSQIIAF
jgi:hypothetical protein